MGNGAFSGKHVISFCSSLLCTSISTHLDIVSIRVQLRHLKVMREFLDMPTIRDLSMNLKLSIFGGEAERTVRAQ